MPILLKLNEKIKLLYRENNFFVFEIDKNKRVNFFASEKEAIILILLNECKLPLSSLEELKNHEEIKKILSSLNENNTLEFYFNFDALGSTTVSPTSKDFNMDVECNKKNKTQKYEFSKFASFRLNNGELVLSSPLAYCSLTVKNIFLFHLLPFIQGETNYEEFINVFSDYTIEIDKFINLLIENQFIGPKGSEVSKDKLMWEYHDLLFHTESRLGKLSDKYSFGSTYRFKNRFSPPVPFEQNCKKQFIELLKPSKDTFTPIDNNLDEILKKRKSIRKFNNCRPITFNEISEFLYRTVRISYANKNLNQGTAYRVYPSAGAIHEIEFYLLINLCTGIETGVYHYNALEHFLTKEDVKLNHLNQMINNSKEAMGKNATKPQILFVLTSKFQKMAWKYEKISYRNTLISLGGIFQTFSLVATSMNLGSCIIGSGNPILFSEALGHNRLEEGSVGEFALGTL